MVVLDLRCRVTALKHGMRDAAARARAQERGVAGRKAAELLRIVKAIIKLPPK